MDVRDEFRVRLRSATFIGAAVIVSLVLYLALVEVLRAAFKPFRGFAAVADVQPLRYGAFAAAVVVIILVRLLRPLLLRNRPGEGAEAVLHKLQRAAIVTLVLGEVPAIVGLGLFLLSGANRDFYVLLFASLVLVFMYFPRRSGWEDWLKDRP